jgi:hypothetical protein
MIRRARDPQTQSLARNLVGPRRLAVRVQQYVRVRLDESGHQRQAGQIYNLGAARGSDISRGPDGLYRRAAHEHHPPVMWLCGFAVEDARGPEQVDGFGRGRRRRRLSRADWKGKHVAKEEQYHLTHIRYLPHHRAAPQTSPAPVSA